MSVSVFYVQQQLYVRCTFPIVHHISICMYKNEL